MDSPTLYIAGFDEAMTPNEIVKVLSMSSPCLAQCVLAPAPLGVSSQTSLPTSTEHILYVHVTFRDPLHLVQFLDTSTPPRPVTEVIGAVLALNGSKVVPRRSISSANSWSPSGLRVVLDPSHFGALLQYQSLKSLADAYPAVYSRYLSLASPGPALSGQLSVALSNHATFVTTLPPTPETPSTALEHPLSQERLQSPCRGHSFPPLVRGSVPRLSAEYEDQGMVGLPTNFFSTDNLLYYQEEVNLAFQASQFSEVADPDVSPSQAKLDTLESQPTNPTTVLNGVSDMQERLHTVEEAYAKARQTLEVTEAQLERQNTEYMRVLGQLSEERKMHGLTLEELRETFARELQDAEQRARQAERLAKDAREELDTFKNDDRDATRLRRDAKFHERQCVKAGQRREQAEAELKKLRASYERLSQEHAGQGGEEFRDASNSLALEGCNPPSDLPAGDPPSHLQVPLATPELLKDELVTTKGALTTATQQLERARAENQASANQLTAVNARVTKLELELDSSEHNLAMKMSELEKAEQSLLSLSHHLADICSEMDQVKAAAQAKIQKLEAKCNRATGLYEQSLDAKAAVTQELEKERLAFASATDATNAQLAEYEAKRATLLEELKAGRSQLVNRSREINRLQGLQATVRAKLEATREELSREKAKATSISNERRNEKQAMVIGLQLSLKNEREQRRILEEDLAVERTKKLELEAELIGSREKVKASEEDKEKLQARLNGVYEDKRRLEAKVNILEAAGDSLRLNVLNGIRVYDTKKKRPLSDVLDVWPPRRPTKRPRYNQSSPEAS